MLRTLFQGEKKTSLLSVYQYFTALQFLNQILKYFHVCVNAEVSPLSRVIDTVSGANYIEFPETRATMVSNAIQVPAGTTILLQRVKRRIMIS